MPQTNMYIERKEDKNFNVLNIVNKIFEGFPTNNKNNENRYNWGGRLLDFLNLGNHVGDWEHNMIRFEDGIPTYVWYDCCRDFLPFKTRRG